MIKLENLLISFKCWRFLDVKEHLTISGITQTYISSNFIHILSRVSSPGNSHASFNPLKKKYDQVLSVWHGIRRSCKPGSSSWLLRYQQHLVAWISVDHIFLWWYFLFELLIVHFLVHNKIFMLQKKANHSVVHSRHGTLESKFVEVQLVELFSHR